MRLLETVNTQPVVLLPGVTLRCDDSCAALLFDDRFTALSSAVLNGGYLAADGYINLRVRTDGEPVTEDPAQTIAQSAEAICPGGAMVGMMTAASMKSLRIVTESLEGETVLVALTSGLDNARRAGDIAEYRSLNALPGECGTINIAVVATAALADEALVELVTVVTEAKAAVLQELGVCSPVSGQLATGTGTDALAVFSRPGGAAVRYAGKHTLLGERVAQLTMHALRDSLAYDTGNRA